MIKIKNWIISILIGAFIVNIVDILLPKNKLKPYITLVCNFIFIFIVISPIVGFLSSSDSLENKILKSMKEYNEKYIQANQDITDQYSNLDLNKEYQENLKNVLELKLQEYGYELEDIDFKGTDIESLKIKQNDLSLSEQNKIQKNTENENSEGSSEVFNNNTKNTKTQNDLKNELIKILDVSIDKIEIN